MNEKVFYEYENPAEALGFAGVYHVVTRDQELSDGAFRTFVHYLEYAQQSGTAWPAHETIMANRGISMRNLSRHKAELVKRGYIEIKHRSNKTSLIIIKSVTQNERLKSLAEQILHDRKAKSGHATDGMTKSGHATDGMLKNNHVEEQPIEEKPNNNMHVAAAENLQWVDEPKRTELAKLDHVTVEYTETWLEWVEADSFPKWMTNPTGWAISQIEASQHPPKKEDPIPVPELPTPALDPGQKILENLRQLMPQAKHLLTRASVAIQEGHYTLSVPSSDWEWLTNRLNDQLESGFAKAVGYEGLEFESLQVESFT